MPIVPAKRTKRKADPGGTLAFQIEHALGIMVVRELVFAPPRKWRFDLAFQSRGENFAVEIEGGLFLPTSGRHNRGAGMRADLDKYAEALILNWRVIRVLPEWVPSGKALTLIERAVKSLPYSLG